MNKREDYEHLERDLDGFYYWFTNKDVDVKSVYQVDEFKDFLQWWKTSEENKGLYYKGTAIYFTYKENKYSLSWTFYDKERIKKAVHLLKDLGAVNIQINYGELD